MGKIKISLSLHGTVSKDYGEHMAQQLVAELIDNPDNMALGRNDRVSAIAERTGKNAFRVVVGLNEEIRTDEAMRGFFQKTWIQCAESPWGDETEAESRATQQFAFLLRTGKQFSSGELAEKFPDAWAEFSRDNPAVVSALNPTKQIRFHLLPDRRIGIQVSG